MLKFMSSFFDLQVSFVAKTLLSVRKVCGSNPGLVKSDAVQPLLRRFFGAVCPGAKPRRHGSRYHILEWLHSKFPLCFPAI